ncbi:hypothetical protein [Rathayibacter sp. VKM Ac-2857]|uniref:hypothetical protein n=1 Tax=Rathayibacter sp. VKM Ac-2857 TaxID=2739020 RepID=UPI001567724A|nr:hypothetical protein [Rathayibacter sp. VKM Ac-2857]NQX14959.1 hypothetical protein [Rathayibacter sp. VKM Ac-2857]
MTLLEPRSGATAWIVALDDVPVARVAPGVVDVLRLLDGKRTLPEVGRIVAAGAEELDGLVAHLSASGLLAQAPRRRQGAVTVIPPLTVQFSTARLTPLLTVIAARLRPAIDRRALRRTVLVALAALLIAGAAAAVAQLPVLAAVAGGPLPLGSVAAVAIALVLATGIHELAHGLVLHLAGGTARRTGLMVFYLTPAFFVDVTDGWRLPRRRHRLAVALAGPAVHASAASVAVLLALASDAGPIREAAAAFALAAAGITALNLLPFVRFDGYYALVAATDTPHLREHAREALDALVTGRPGDRRPWVLVLGLGSLIAPTVLVLLAAGRIAHWSSSAGVVGAVLVSGLGVLLAVVAARACARWVQRPGRRGRRVALLALALGAVLAASLSVPVPRTVTVGYVSDAGGAWLVAPEPDALDALRTGAPVALETQGLLRHEPVGVGAVGAPLSTGPTTAPLDCFAPVRVPGEPVSVASRPLLLDTGETVPRAGAAVVRIGDDRPALMAAFEQLRGLVDVVTDPQHSVHDHSDQR